MPDEFIVVGAGASGLMIAKVLSQAGNQVHVIEARGDIGGRILTIPAGEFSMHVEAGAEFVHGNLPYTIDLLQEANIPYHKITGEIWNARHGRPHKQEDFIEDYSLLARRLKELKTDVSVASFLQTNFSEAKYQDLRASISGYVEGYDLADVNYASAFALRDEWVNDDDEDQFRIDTGYRSILTYLKSACERKGTKFIFNTVVKKIEWAKDRVKLFDSNGNEYQCSKLIITVPLGILQAESFHKAYIEFSPGLNSHLTAARNMGYGEVIKFVLEFNEIFWENKNIVRGQKMKDLGFIFGPSEIPTWWTQSPIKKPILTGWFGGPRVNAKKKLNDEALLQIAFDSLSVIFNIDHSVLIEKLVASRVFNWSEDEFSLGGYAYSSLGREHHLSILSQPIEETIFFSGEALGSGPTLGTVESALAAAHITAKQVLHK